MKIIGTHNTMTYRNPKKWYLWPVKWIAQCQSVDYKAQHEKYGSNCFDLRIFWDKEGNIEFRHGLFAYEGSDLYEILAYAEKNNIYCRIIFEERKFPSSLRVQSKEMGLSQKFSDLCKKIENDYPNLKCWSGRNCETWEVLHKFKDDNNVIDNGYYSSVTSMFKSDNKILRMIDDWCPRLYAVLFNKKNKEYVNNMEDNEEQIIINSFDFIQI